MNASLADRAIRILGHHLKCATRGVEYFLTEVSRSPETALASCDADFYDVALRAEAARCIGCIENGTLTENMIRLLQAEVCSSARNRSNSTSITRNLMDRARNSAKAKLLEELEALL